VLRPPVDFDKRLNWELMQAQLKKFEENPELNEATKQTVNELESQHTKKFIYQQLFLGAPDSYLREKFEELGLDAEGSFDDFLRSVQEQRERDPDFLQPIGPGAKGQLFTMTTGASYPSATITAELTGSYLFTDIYVRWLEIEMDRQSHSAENKVWAPFAKALQNARLKYLNNLRLEHALTVRREKRLESLRGFLTKVWSDARTGDEFDSANAIRLAEELGVQVRNAEEEWKKIDRDLLKVVGATAMAPLLAAGPLIATGHADFLAAAVALAGAVPLVRSTLERRSFPNRFPAAFFMKVEDAAE
jgi:hypothetical protein